MKIDEQLNLLKRIKIEDAPPFLYTRIKQQLNNLDTIEAPIKWKWAFAATALIILLLNVSILVNKNFAKNNQSLETVMNSMGLSNSNNLYNE